MQFSFIIKIILFVFASYFVLCSDNDKKSPISKKSTEKIEKQSKSSLKPIIKNSREDRSNRGRKHVNFEDQSLDDSIGFEAFSSNAPQSETEKRSYTKEKSEHNGLALNRYGTYFALPLSLSLIVFII